MTRAAQPVSRRVDVTDGRLVIRKFIVEPPEPQGAPATPATQPGGEPAATATPPVARRRLPRVRGARRATAAD